MPETIKIAVEDRKRKMKALRSLLLDMLLRVIQVREMPLFPLGHTAILVGCS
jgi:hypothetical protein